MTEIEDLNPTGVTRRRLLVRGAVLGGVAWAAPAVTTVGGAAFAVSPGAQDISFIAVLVTCGGTQFRAKWETDFSGAPDECGTSFAVDDCDDDLGRVSPGGTEGPCPPGVTATPNADGSVTLHLGTCTLDDFVVKCGVASQPGDQGCFDPGENPANPAIGSSGDQTFHPCPLP